MAVGDILASYWSLILYTALFPFVACILILMTPASLKKYMVKFIDMIFFIEIGTIALIKVVMFIEGLTWAALIRSTYIHYQEYSMLKENRLQGIKTHHISDPNPQMTEMNMKLKLWREQRNCYIAAWGFTAWWYVLAILFCFFILFFCFNFVCYCLLLLLVLSFLVRLVVFCAK